MLELKFLLADAKSLEDHARVIQLRSLSTRFPLSARPRIKPGRQPGTGGRRGEVFSTVISLVNLPIILHAIRTEEVDERRE